MTLILLAFNQNLLLLFLQIDDQRRTHNYDEFICTFISMLAQEGNLFTASADFYHYLSCSPVFLLCLNSSVLGGAPLLCNVSHHVYGVFFVLIS